MDIDYLRKLEKLNQLSLTPDQESEVLGFFERRFAESEKLDAFDTKDAERMVHVMPMVNILREDVADEPFDRDDLQSGAPETMDGYWQVPRLVE
ncbi:MAG: Asp-tRNA(Asn)/Glu-tRNA(Gln) amidotransferase subunit GatC [Eggerthellaceae bacterium]|nr:Asp-tRNA(Asn)/Glu-tRNA(Gln) amidotransferase subunit GatC [Eggerthellaceae bacterium]